MDNDVLWKVFAYGYFAVNTVCILVLIDLLVFGKPYITLFLLIFSLTIYVNFKIFQRHSSRSRFHDS